MVQHADDCTNTLKDEESLEKTLHIIEEFSYVSGLKLNLEKTECILTGFFLYKHTLMKLIFKVLRLRIHVLKHGCISWL